MSEIQGEEEEKGQRVKQRPTVRGMDASLETSRPLGAETAVYSREQSGVRAQLVKCLP